MLRSTLAVLRARSSSSTYDMKTRGHLRVSNVSLEGLRKKKNGLFVIYKNTLNTVILRLQLVYVNLCRCPFHFTSRKVQPWSYSNPTYTSDWCQNTFVSEELTSFSPVWYRCLQLRCSYFRFHQHDPDRGLIPQRMPIFLWTQRFLNSRQVSTNHTGFCRDLKSARLP